MSLTLLGQGRNFSVTGRCLFTKCTVDKVQLWWMCRGRPFRGPGLPGCLGIRAARALSRRWCMEGWADLRAGLLVALRLISWADLELSKYMGFFHSCVFYDGCRNGIYLKIYLKHWRNVLCDPFSAFFCFNKADTSQLLEQNILNIKVV